MVNILRIIGVVSILFINFTEIYSVTADWSDNVGNWLWVILALSFVRELISIFATKVENLPRVIRGIIRSIAILATGCASSIAFIFPKLIYLESNYKDSIEVPKFKIKITRNYSVDELYDYLNTISVSNPIPVPIKMKIAELASDRAQVRDLYEEQVELMRQLSEPAVVVRPMHDLEVILNWCDNHVLYVQIGVAVVVAALVVGFGYYVYTHPHINYRDAAESLLEKSSGDTRDSIDNLRQVQSEANNLLSQLQNVVQKAENKLGASSVSQDIYERLSGLKEECKGLEESINSGLTIVEMELERLTENLNKLDSKIDGVNQKALEFNSNIILDNVKRFSEINENIASLENRVCENFGSDTTITDGFAENLDKVILDVSKLQKFVNQNNHSLERIQARISKLRTKADGEHTAIGIMVNDNRAIIDKLDVDMKDVTEQVGSLCALLTMALTEEDALGKYKEFVEVYKKLGIKFLQEDSGDKPGYIQFLKQVFIASRGGKAEDE